MRRLLLCLVVLIAGCDLGRRFVGIGEVVRVDPSAPAVTIRHERIPGLGEAATSTFAVHSPEVAATLQPGSRVRFVLRRSDGGLQLTRATVLAGGGSPGLHDHTPHHGGIVAMAGMIHLEALARPDGRVMVYLTDLWRRPLPLADVAGTVTLDLIDGTRTLPLASDDTALTATGPPLTGARVNARVELRRPEQSVAVSFLLPLDQDAAGAAGVPAGGCAPPRPSPAGGPAPRCVLAFANPVAALATSPDAATLLVAMVDLGISAWHLPAGTFAVGFAPAPAVVLATPEAPHREAPNAIAINPNGREAAVAMENRIVVYAVDSGRVLRAFDGPGGIVRAVSWLPDGDALLVATFYTPAAFVLDASDGTVRRRLPIEREGAAVAAAPDGSLAVGSETGTIALFSADPAAPPRRLGDRGASVRALMFAGERLAAVSEDGLFRVFDPSTATAVLTRRIDGGARVVAFDPAGSMVATAGLTPRIQLTALADGASLGTLDWHHAQVLSLTWAGDALVSGDTAGEVALWKAGSATLPRK